MILPTLNSTLFPYTTLFRSIGVSYFLPRMVGSSVAAELMLTGRFIHAERALSLGLVSAVVDPAALDGEGQKLVEDRKSTRLNSSHVEISYAVFCLKKKTTTT